MQLIKFKINNNTDDVQNIELFSVVNDAKIDCTYSISEVDYFKGVTFKSIDNIICQKSFEGGRIFICGIPVYLTEWIKLEQSTNQEINIALLLNNVDSICFKLNPKRKIEVTMTLNEQLKNIIAGGKQ